MADFTAKVPVRRANAAPSGFVLEKYVDIGGGAHAPGVAIVGADTDVTLTGDMVVDTLGALNDSAVVNPAAASATIPALMRGELTELLALVARIGEVQASPTANTLLDRLKTLATAIGSPSDTKWDGSAGSASLIAIAKKIAAP
jgi:hypothetical protein